MWKWLLDLLKPPVVALVEQLKTNRDANIAKIESIVGSGEVTVEAAVTGFITSEAKKNVELELLAGIFEPGLISALKNAAASGEATVPQLYDAGVAWLVHEESVL